jgi:ATP-binding protein involved in chromosome partitioning
MTQAEGKGVISLQVDFTCDEKCEMCERFFKCKSPQKLKIFDRRRMARAKQTMAKIKHKVAICAGKGGVGKSTVTSNLAAALAMRNKKVSVLDQDLDGSCIPRMMGVLDKKLIMERQGIKPVEGLLGIQIVAMANILQEEDTATWYHELRRNATEEFIAHVQYGIRDYLLIDLPPGTSSDAVNLMQYISDLDGMIVVTAPSGVSQIVAKRAIIMAIEGGVEVLGVVENMSGYVCPKCSKIFYPLRHGGGEKIAEELGVPFLGRIPLDPSISNGSDIGLPVVYSHPDSLVAQAVNSIADQVEQKLGSKG